MLILNILLLITLWNLIISTINLKYGLKNNKFYCGVIGFSGSNEFDKSKIETLMLWNSLLRGEDATGMYTPKSGVVKNSNPAYKFIIDKDTTIQKDKVFIGHVRSATRGSKVDKNAHPFKEGNLVLVHNGTITNPWTLCNHYKLSTSDYDVDSHAICAILAKEKKPDVLSQIEGGAAIVFTDVTKPDIIYVFKNKERPLFKGFIDGNMYISSIEESLKYIGCKHIKSFEDDILFTIKDGLIKNRLPIVHKPLPIANTYNNHHNYNFSNINNNNINNNALKGYNYYVNNIDNFLGMYLRATGTYSFWASKPVDVRYGKYYFVEGIGDNSRLVIRDESNNVVEVGLGVFDYEECYLTINKKILFLNDLKAKNGDVILFKKGDISIIKSIDYEKALVNVYSPVAQAIYNVDFKYIRALTKRDEWDINKNLNNIKNNKCDFPPIDEDTPIDNQLDEDDDDNYYDSLFNSEDMRVALEQQNQYLEDLLEFGSKAVKEENIKEFNKIIFDTQSHLVNMADLLVTIEKEEEETENA